ncbi:MAG: hypothetical protein ACRD2P_05205 [Terriglobia bacterium]
MLRHQNIPDDREAQFRSQITQGLREMPHESFLAKYAGTAIGARRQIMQMIEAKVSLLPVHLTSLALFAGERIHKRQCIGHPRVTQTLKVCDSGYRAE